MLINASVINDSAMQLRAAHDFMFDCKCSAILNGWEGRRSEHLGHLALPSQHLLVGVGFELNITWLDMPLPTRYSCKGMVAKIMVL